MRQRLIVAVVTAAAILALSAPAASAQPTRTTYVFADCWTGLEDATFRATGHEGQIVHSAGIIAWESWFYTKDTGWFLAGTQANPSWDVLNTTNGIEVFRGKFVFTSAILGDFAGSFTLQEGPSRWHGRSDGRSTDGRGLLWKGTIGSVDPTPYLPLPTCATGVPRLNEVEIIAP